MIRFKKAAALVLLLAVFFSAPVHARAESSRTDLLIQELVNYFLHYQDNAETDYVRILSEMNTLDPDLAQTWSHILDFWIYLNRDMQVHNSVLPDGLPNDDSLCIVIMGYYLKSDGTMRSELYDRLEVALQSAEKYPNSYILCTGGGKNATEAGQMAKWLIKQGIPEERIIRETKATSTIENATYGCALLYRDYPQVSSLAVITSDYHIYRSCLYFHTQSALDAQKLGVAPMQVIASATCPIRPLTAGDIETQAEGISILTGISIEDLSQPNRDQLIKIQISGPAEYQVGHEPNLIVTAHYASGFSREVTDDAVFTFSDLDVSGHRSGTASYEEGGIQKSAAFDLEILQPVAEAEPDDIPETVPPTEEIPAVSADEITQAGPVSAVCLLVICILLLIILLQIRAKQQKKRRRRPKPTIKLD